MSTRLSVERYLAGLPKAELHVHLEGAIRPETLLILAKRNGVTLPAATAPELQNWFRYRNFNHFIEIYFAISSCLKHAEDYELIAYEFGAEMARQNVRYAEVTFSPSTHYFSLHVPHDTYFGGLERGRARARAEFGVEMRWVFDIVRNIEGEAENRAYADFTTQVAIEGMKHGVVALGLGGAEVGYPPERFAPWFERALSEGLHSAPHAGETEGPASVWGALRTLGAERIGHGVRSIEDAELVAYLARQRVPLEVCPTSNLRLGVYGSLAEHPLRRLYAAGVPLSINSDDPPLFNTTLNQEVGLLDQVFGFDLDTIDELVLNGIRQSFQSEDWKREREAEFREEMRRLRQECGLA